MASNKSRNVGITRANRQRLPLNASLRRSNSDDQARKNLKRKAVESSQANENMNDRSEIFRPWQSLSEPLENVGDEIDEIGEWEKLRKWAAACVVVYGAYAASLVYVASTSHVDRPLPKPNEGDIHRQSFMGRRRNEGSRLSILHAFQVKDQVESKKRKSRASEFVGEELKSLKSGMEAVAKALERGNLRNYTEKQLCEEISKVGSLSGIAEMKVYQALTADPNSARAFIACPITRRDLWLKVKFGDEFLM